MRKFQLSELAIWLCLKINKQWSFFVINYPNTFLTYVFFIETCSKTFSKNEFSKREYLDYVNKGPFKAYLALPEDLR